VVVVQEGAVLEYIAVVATPSKFDHIVNTSPETPHNPAQPSVAVPDGGATWAFILAAVITIGVAAIKRQVGRSSAKAVSLTIGFPGV
jgi:hypothetical protein